MTTVTPRLPEIRRLIEDRDVSDALSREYVSSGEWFLALRQRYASREAHRLLVTAARGIPEEDLPRDVRDALSDPRFEINTDFIVALRMKRGEE